jgi:hypothetical protein
VNRNEVKNFVNINILGSNEVQEMLMVNRQRLKALVDAGKITPIKELKREMLFFRLDVEMLKQEMMLDSRTNLFKMAGVDDGEQVLH